MLPRFPSTSRPMKPRASPTDELTDWWSPDTNTVVFAILCVVVVFGWTNVVGKLQNSQYVAESCAEVKGHPTIPLYIEASQLLAK